jgi:hypothetical protein
MTPQFYNSRNSDDGGEAVAGAEETLRLMTQVEPPAGLEDRVHRRLGEARLESAQAEDARWSGQWGSFWRLWMPSRRLQYAGVAVLMAAVAASTWTVRHTAGAREGELLPPGSAEGNAGAKAGSRGFGSAGAERRPSSLAPIRVPATGLGKPVAKTSGASAAPTPAVSTGLKKKPSASRLAAKGTGHGTTAGSTVRAATPVTE